MPHDLIVRDRLSGMSLTQCSKKYGVSRASVVRFVRDAQRQFAGVGQSRLRTAFSARIGRPGSRFYTCASAGRSCGSRGGRIIWNGANGDLVLEYLVLLP
jgi:hypothetical protein